MSVPEIYFKDINKGLVLLEDFGEETNTSLKQAMIDGRDDIIQNDFDYSWEEDEYYQAPLKVVEVK